MASAPTPAVRPAVALLHRRWLQLLIGILGMVAIANLQYGWTLFVDPINAKFKFGRVGIQLAFTIFVFCETWLVPIEGLSLIHI